MNNLWYTKSISDISKEFMVNTKTGLLDNEVGLRQKKYGVNKLPEGKTIKWWQLLLRQFNNPMVVILLIAAGLTFWLAFKGANSNSDDNYYIDFTVITLAVLVNVLIGFWQEFRSSKIFEKLQQLIEIKARIKRGGKIYEINSRDIVPGDLIVLKGGTKVPADIRLISSANLTVNESLLTGESLSVSKQIKTLSKDVALGDRSNMLYMGTFIDEGDGIGIVVGTGSKTELGQIAELTASVSEEATPLQERLSHFGKILAFFILVFAVIIFAIGFWDSMKEGKGFLDAFAGIFTITVAVIVAAIPEGLPAALSVVLAVSAQRLLKRNGLVKKLIGAETLGSASVIVTDKTGTLTTGKMKIEKLIDTEDSGKAALILALANDAFIEEGGEKEIRGEETDRAKIKFYYEQGGSDKELKKHKRCAILPFNQDKKYIASFHKYDNGSIHIYLSGAPEILLNLSNKTEKEKNNLNNNVEELAGQGFRMIGVAEKIIKSDKFNCEDLESLDGYVNNLNFIGTAALRDPIREDVKQAVKETREAGIKIIMATGDHRLTARSIGRELGFNISNEHIISGQDITDIEDKEFSALIKKAEIFSRVSPAHKMRIIQELRNNGEVVAMTGDGVNDAPALKSSDIGIALGSGTDVTKEAADLVLMDNSFSVITEAIKQGRIAFDNIRKVTLFLLANSFTEIILVLASLLLKVPLPVTAVMILWANLVEDGFPNFALAFEPGEKDIMKRKPYKRNEPIINEAGYVIIFIVGIIADLFLLGVYLFLYYNYLDVLGLAYIRTITFSMLATNSLIYVFSIKSLSTSILKTNIFNNLFLIFAVVIGLVLMTASIYLPQLQLLLGTVSLKLSALLFILGVGVLQLFLIEVVKWLYYNSTIRRLA